MSLTRAAFACGLLAAVGAAGCGGSSSETPPPLKPDLSVKQAPAPVDGGSTSGETGNRGEPGDVQGAAPSTWGSGEGKSSPSAKRFPEAQ
jgi:hypothetical protein